MNFKSKINTYEDICEILKIDPGLVPDVSSYAEEDKEAAISMFRLWKASKAVLNWEDTGCNTDDQKKYQYKCEIECNLGNEAGWGSGFAYSGCRSAGDYSAVGVRLLWPDSTMAKHMSKVMREDFMNVMIIPKK